MKSMIRRCVPLICIAPGTTATLFTLLAIANGGEVFGLSTKWLLNCSLLAVPPITFVLMGIVMVLLENEG